MKIVFLVDHFCLSRLVLINEHVHMVAACLCVPNNECYSVLFLLSDQLSDLSSSHTDQLLHQWRESLD